MNNNTLKFYLRNDKLFGILALITLSVPVLFSVFAYEGFETVKVAVFYLLVGWGLLIFLHHIRNQVFSESAKFYLPGKKILYSMIFLGIMFLLSVFFSIDHLYSFFGTYYRFTGGLVFMVSWGIFFIILLTSLTESKFLALVKLLVFGGLLVSIVGILQSLGVGYYESISSTGFIRAPSLLGNPNFSSMFLVGLLPFAIALGFLAKNFWEKIYYACSVFIILFACVLLSSRGSLVALVVSGFLAVTLFFWKIGKNPKFVKLGLTAFVFVGFVAGSLSLVRPNSINSLINFSDTNLTLRFQVWRSAVSQILDRPILGFGPSTFHMAFETKRGYEMSGQTGLFDDAHNLFLQLGATVGFPFMVGLIYMVGLAFFRGIRNFIRFRNYVTLASLSGLAALLIAFSFNPVSSACYVLLACLTAGLLFEDRAVYAPPVIFKKFISVGYIFSIGFMFLGGAIFFSEHIFYFAYQSYYLKNYQTSYNLSRIARFINPSNQLFKIYETGSLIKLNGPVVDIENGISSVIKLHPREAKTRVYAANLYNTWYLQSQNSEYLKKAALELKKSLTIDKLYSERYAKLGLYYFQLGDFEASAHYARYALALEDKYLPAWVLLARIYQIEKNYTKMSEALNKAFLIDPALPELRILISLLKNGTNPAELPIRVLVFEGTLE